MMDGNGKVVDTLRVVVSPLRPKKGEDIKTIKIVGGSVSTSYLCDDHTCIDASARRKDGSTSTSKPQSAPPTPPTP
jgi:hypothetical protein